MSVSFGGPTARCTSSIMQRTNGSKRGSQGLLALTAAALIVLVASQQDLRAAPLAQLELGEAEPVVEMQLFADVSHVTPGAHFQLAVQFAIPEHWHIYWENQGDTGLPTRVEVEGPEGYTIGEALYPGPQRFEVTTGIHSYGYEESVCLLVPVSAPLSAQVGSTASFRVKGSWLVCQEACFRQAAESELGLSVATRVEDQVPRPTHPELFKHWLARLPRPQAELSGLTVAWSESDTRSPTLELHVADCDALEFFPARDDTLPLLTSQTLSAANPPDEPNPGPGLRLSFDARVYGQEQLAPAIRGVLRVRRGKQERFYRFAVPRPND